MTKIQVQLSETEIVTVTDRNYSTQSDEVLFGSWDVIEHLMSKCGEERDLGQYLELENLRQKIDHEMYLRDERDQNTLKEFLTDPRRNEGLGV